MIESFINGDKGVNHRVSVGSLILQQMEDVISLGIGEPDFTTPWHVREEAIYALEKGRTTYTLTLGYLS